MCAEYLGAVIPFDDHSAVFVEAHDPIAEVPPDASPVDCQADPAASRKEQITNDPGHRASTAAFSVAAPTSDATAIGSIK